MRGAIGLHGWSRRFGRCGSQGAEQRRDQHVRDQPAKQQPADHPPRTGTTAGGGANKLSCGNFGCGTIFAITTGGTLTTLHSFNGFNGFLPAARLLEATPGIFYGTTNQGGAFSFGIRSAWH